MVDRNVVSKPTKSVHSGGMIFHYASA